jgi:hypothetical protein
MAKVARFEHTVALTEEGDSALARFQRGKGSSIVVLGQEAKGEAEERVHTSGEGKWSVRGKGGGAPVVIDPF